MPIENIGPDDGVEALNENWPDGSEPIKQGDDHLRNIKKAVKNQARFTPGKNLLINGDFSVWQRGTVFDEGDTVSNALYTADRWQFVGMPLTFDIQQKLSGVGYGLFLSAYNLTGRVILTQKIELSGGDVLIQGEDSTFTFVTAFDAAHPKTDYIYQLRWVEEGDPSSVDLGSSSHNFSIPGSEMGTPLAKSITMQIPQITT